jgi:hypothetical protein
VFPHRAIASLDFFPDPHVSAPAGRVSCFPSKEVVLLLRISFQLDCSTIPPHWTQLPRASDCSTQALRSKAWAPHGLLGHHVHREADFTSREAS